MGGGRWPQAFCSGAEVRWSWRCLWQLLFSKIGHLPIKKSFIKKEKNSAHILRCAFTGPVYERREIFPAFGALIDVSVPMIRV